LTTGACFASCSSWLEKERFIRVANSIS
jgi:hypothetical protein